MRVGAGERCSQSAGRCSDKMGKDCREEKRSRNRMVEFFEGLCCLFDVIVACTYIEDQGAKMESISTKRISIALGDCYSLANRLRLV